MSKRRGEKNITENFVSLFVRIFPFVRSTTTKEADEKEGEREKKKKKGKNEKG